MGHEIVAHCCLISFFLAPKEASVKPDNRKVTLSFSFYPAFFPPPQCFNTVKAFWFTAILPKGFVATPSPAL